LAQKIVESFAKVWERFSQLFNIVPNHGFFKYAIMQYFYNGLNDESRQIID
jgi:hypothetical protein